MVYEEPVTSLDKLKQSIGSTIEKCQREKGERVHTPLKKRVKL